MTAQRRPVPRTRRPDPPIQEPRANLSNVLQAGSIPAVTILPLRLFLGVTFIYAGIQKLTDPGFFHAGASTYIGSQILAFSRNSPIATVLHHMMEHAVFIGALTIATEMAVGALVLLGLFTRPAALVGLVLSFTFFLSASWNTYPFFYGSDIVFVMCWLTLALTGPGPLALDSVVRPALLRNLQRRLGPSAGGWALPLVLAPPHTALADDEEAGGPSSEAAAPRRGAITRAEALVASIAGLVLVVLGLHPRASASGTALKLPTTATAPGGAPTPGPTAGSSSAPPAGIPAGFRKIGNVRQLPSNAAGYVNDPKSGDPAIIIHGSGSTFYAYDAVCTHAGCTVQYDSSQRLLVCPCHGGTFDPAHGAQVVGGPPPTPLAPIDMKIDSKGDIYIA
ncbi:MAG TPA: TQO small subunit DoxD [Chloroflexota bacterium]|nr:TQO small subunit DoxD [Chloroflexota bacterium]